ncbi:zinc finger protein 665-like [Oppia nitens]|uniref:zinc finger protein 665-like n=1 Tax=Oppia nitens TaxID=1686743 RepID=UPI0023DB8944|nr:zinc finger protein 665-like [Oppia nitens]
MVVCIEVEDLFDELTAENNRLVNELLFTNKCLTEMKDQMNLVYKKYEELIDAEDLNRWQTLQQKWMDTAVIDDYNTAVSLETDKTNHNKSELNEKIKQTVNDIVIISDDKNRKTSLLSVQTNSMATDDRPFVCRHEDCGKRFKMKAHLHHHYSQCHKNSEYKCYVCHKTFTEIKKWIKHEKTHDMNQKKVFRMFKCSECGQYMSTKDALRKHYKVIHPLMYTTTTDTNSASDDRLIGNDLVLDDKYVSVFHQKYYDLNSKQYVCPDSGCGMPFDTSIKLYNHMNTIHDIESIEDYLQIDNNNNNNMTGNTITSNDSERQLLQLLKQNNYDNKSDRYLCPFGGCGLKFSICLPGARLRQIIQTDATADRPYKKSAHQDSPENLPVLGMRQIVL